MIEQDRKMKEFMKKEREKMTMQEHRGEMSMLGLGALDASRDVAVAVTCCYSRRWAPHLWAQPSRRSRS
jgi:hypothetical protein